jgi:hypothetical protein
MCSQLASTIILEVRVGVGVVVVVGSSYFGGGSRQLGLLSDPGACLKRSMQDDVKGTGSSPASMWLCGGNRRIALSHRPHGLRFLGLVLIIKMYSYMYILMIICRTALESITKHA